MSIFELSRPGAPGAGAAIRIIRVGSTAEAAAVNRELVAEPYPRRRVSALLIDSPAGVPALEPEDACCFDLVLAAGDPAAESARNTPVVLAADPAAELARLDAAVQSHPQVAEVFVRLLRATAGLPLETAIEMESLAFSTLLAGTDFRLWLAGRNLPAPAGKRAPDTADSSPVLVERRGNQLELTLNDPSRHNAYSAALRDHLVEALMLPVLDDSISAVLLRGAGRSFCSGADLTEFGQATDLAAAHLIRTRQHAGRLLDRLGPRASVHLHGACIGAGLEVPAYAHEVAARRSAFFRLPELGMGLIPGAGGSVSIPRRIGRWRTLYMFLAGIDIRAGRALQWGLVDRIAED